MRETLIAMVAAISSAADSQRSRLPWFRGVRLGLFCLWLHDKESPSARLLKGQEGLGLFLGSWSQAWACFPDVSTLTEPSPRFH